MSQEATAPHSLSRPSPQSRPDILTPDTRYSKAPAGHFSLSKSIDLRPFWAKTRPGLLGWRVPPPNRPGIPPPATRSSKALAGHFSLPKSIDLGPLWAWKASWPPWLGGRLRRRTSGLASGWTYRRADGRADRQVPPLHIISCSPFCRNTLHIQRVLPKFEALFTRRGWRPVRMYIGTRIRCCLGR